MRQVTTSNNCDDDDVNATILKLRELEQLYTQARLDAMKLRRKLEGKCIVLTTGNRLQSKYCDCGHENENNRTAVTQEPPQQPQKRGRGRPRKVKDSLELIRGDIDDRIDDGSTPRVNHYNCTCNSGKNLMNNTTNGEYDEFINAVYSIENEELYVKTQIGKFYDINTMQLRGWFNSYLKTNVWIE